MYTDPSNKKSFLQYLLGYFPFLLWEKDCSPLEHTPTEYTLITA